MSFLDDELRTALKRMDPSPGFAERVFEEIAGSASSRSRRERSIWDALVAVFWKPWAAAALAACLLLVAAGAFWATRNDEVAPVASVTGPAPTAVAESDAATATPDRPSKEAIEDVPAAVALGAGNAPGGRRTGGRRSGKTRPASARDGEKRVENREGELAARRVVVALQIASSTLSDAQKLAQGK